MDILQESASLQAEDSSGELRDREWNACQTPDRRHADALLNISEDSFAEDEDAYQLSIDSGWGEVIRGWGRLPPLASLFQIQKKSKKSKAVDSEYHCLLCVDVKPLKHDESDNSTYSIPECERNCISDKQHQCNGSRSPLLCQKRPSKCPSDVSPSVTEHHTFKETTKQALCGDEAFLEADQLTAVETFPESANGHVSDKQCAKMAERDGNVSTIISSFSVLPPVKAEGSSDRRIPSLMARTDAILDRSSAHSVAGDGGGSHGTFGAGTRAGVEKICEFIQAGGDSDVLQGRCGPSPPGHQGSPSSHWSSQPSRHLRFALGVRNSKKRDPPLNIVGDFFPPAGYRLVRNIKYEDLSRVSVKNNHGNKLYIALKSRSVPETNPQLPALLGTRVPLPATSHRLL